jgi:hypothetical protein
MNVITEILTMSVSDECYYRNTDYERIWWMLLQKHWLWTYLMNVITETLIMSVSDECYYRNALCTINYIWNELPFSIRQASSHNAFKTKVKSHILNDDVP